MKKDIYNETKVRVFTNKEVAIGNKLQIVLEFLNMTKKVEKLKVLFNRFGEETSIIKHMIKVKEENNKIEYRTEVQLKELGNYFFFFTFEIDGQMEAIKLDSSTEEPIILKPEEESWYWRVLVVQDGFEIPEEMTNKIAYQIFLDRFFRGSNLENQKQKERNYRRWGEMPEWYRNEKGEFHNNDFFGGNLKGIQEKLDYLKSLSVGIIYISPINYSLL